MIALRLFHRLEELASTTWDELVARCPDSTIFQTRAWLDPWWSAFRTDPSELWILCAYEEDELVGLAPLVLTRTERQAPVLSWLGSGHSDYHTFPARNAEPRIIEALLDGIAARVPAGTLIDLPEVPQFAALAICLTRRAQNRGSRIVAHTATPCPWLELTPELLAQATSKSSVKRSERKLQELGQLRFVRLETAAATQPLLPAFFAQHVRRWDATASPSLFNRPQNPSFYTAAAHSLAAIGALQFGVLLIDDRPVAQHFGLRSRGKLIWYKPTFDIDLAKYSPGEVLLKHLIVDAAEQGLRAFDFTRGDEFFKSRFAQSVAYNTSFTWFPGSVPALIARGRTRARHLRDGYRGGSRVQESAKPRRALILDVHSSAGVEVVQSLGRLGVEVHAASAAASCYAYRSKYVAKRFQQPPANDHEHFNQWLRNLDAQSGPYHLIVPSTENSLLPLIALPSDDLLRRRAVLASVEAMNVALSKQATWDLAQSLGVSVPQSRLLESGSDSGNDNDSYPLVLKPIHSLVKTQRGGHQHLTAVVVRNAAERQTHLARLLPLTPVQEQAYCSGFGLGVECLYDRGQMVWTFVHERVHELPLTGGGSSYRRSRPFNARAICSAKRLLDALDWHGVAMVEFKIDRDGAVCLMEINPRFWGSLALGIDAGVNFPAGLWALAVGATPGPQPRYDVAYYTRNLPRDVEWLKENLRASHADPLLLTQPRLRSVLEYFRPMLGSESHDHFSWRDPAVYAAQFTEVATANVGAVWRRLVHQPLFERRVRRHCRRVLQASTADGRKIRRVLFLCYGNICRSPFADRYARSRRASVEIESAGFHSTVNRPSPEHIVSAAQTLGVSLADWRSKAVNDEMLDASDLIVVMDEDNWQRTLAMRPELADRLIMLGAAAGLATVSIVDPYSLGEEEARNVLRDIMRAVDRLFERLGVAS